ncbi:hypothetical protein SNEBB_004710 [Seison nebaliae]|nr:hypothetical protein SNEBB_004710 [Seison nebaliae]
MTTNGFLDVLESINNEDEHLFVDRTEEEEKKEEMTLLKNGIPNVFASLIRDLVHSLFSWDYVIVINSLMLLVCASSSALCNVLQYEDRFIRQILKDLMKEGEQPQRPKQVPHYYIDYAYVLRVIRYKLEKIRKELEHLESSHEIRRSNYRCSKCGKEYSDMDIPTLLSAGTDDATEDNLLNCLHCNGLVIEEDKVEQFLKNHKNCKPIYSFSSYVGDIFDEDKDKDDEEDNDLDDDNDEDESENNQPKTLNAREKLELFNSQFDGIFERLSIIENIQIADHLRDPQPAPLFGNVNPMTGVRYDDEEDAEKKHEQTLTKSSAHDNYRQLRKDNGSSSQHGGSGSGKDGQWSGDATKNKGTSLGAQCNVIGTDYQKMQRHANMSGISIIFHNDDEEESSHDINLSSKNVSIKFLDMQRHDLSSPLPSGSNTSNNSSSKKQNNSSNSELKLQLSELNQKQYSELMRIRRKLTLSHITETLLVSNEIEKDGSDIEMKETKEKEEKKEYKNNGIPLDLELAVATNAIQNEFGGNQIDSQKNYYQNEIMMNERIPYNINQQHQQQQQSQGYMMDQYQNQNNNFPDQNYHQQMNYQQQQQQYEMMNQRNHYNQNPQSPSFYHQQQQQQQQQQQYQQNLNNAQLRQTNVPLHQSRSESSLLNKSYMQNVPVHQHYDMNYHRSQQEQKHMMNSVNSIDFTFLKSTKLKDAIQTFKLHDLLHYLRLYQLKVSDGLEYLGSGQPKVRIPDLEERKPVYAKDKKYCKQTPSKLKEINRYRQSLKMYISIEMLQDGYFRSHKEISELIRMQNARREALGPEHPEYLREKLEDNITHMQVLKEKLTASEYHRQENDNIGVYDAYFYLALYFQQVNELWLVDMFLKKALETATDAEIDAIGDSKNIFQLCLAEAHCNLGVAAEKNTKSAFFDEMALNEASEALDHHMECYKLTKENSEWTISEEEAAMLNNDFPSLKLLWMTRYSKVKYSTINQDEMEWNSIDNDILRAYDAIKNKKEYSKQTNKIENMQNVTAGSNLHSFVCKNVNRIRLRIADMNRKNLPERIRNLESAYVVAIESNDSDLIYLTAYFLGTTYEKSNKPKEALQHLTNYLKYAFENEKTEEYGEACEAIARCYEKQGDYSAAIEYLEEYLKMSAKKESTTLAKACISLGEIYFRLGQYANAFNYMMKSYQIGKQQLKKLEHREHIESDKAIDILWFNKCCVSYGIAAAHIVLDDFENLTITLNNDNCESPSEILDNPKKREAKIELCDWHDDSQLPISFILQDKNEEKSSDTQSGKISFRDKADRIFYYYYA